MKKILYVVIILFVIILSTSCLGRRQRIASALTQTAAVSSDQVNQPESQPVSTEPPAAVSDASSAILFKDDFQDGVADNWNITAGWDVQQDGDVYTFDTSILGSAWVPGGHSWDNYVFRASLQITSGVAALNFRLSQEGRYLVTFSNEGLYLLKETTPGNISVLTRVDPISFGGWHNVTVGGVDDHIMVYVDQTLRIDYLDSDPLSSGTIAVGASDSTEVSVDNVLVNIPQTTFPAHNASISPPVSNIAMPDIAGPPLADIPAAADIEEVIPPQAPAGPAEVSFTIEGSNSATISPGSCITVAWNVSNALEVYFQGNAANTNGFLDDCPIETISYVLEVIDLNGQMAEYVVTANVEQGSNGGQVEALPDLSMNVDFSEPRTAGQPFTVVMHIHNSGNANSAVFTAVWFSAENVVGCSTDVSVPAGETVDHVCSFGGYPESGMYNWSANVDVENEILESNEGNNLSWGGVSIQ